MSDAPETPNAPRAGSDAPPLDDPPPFLGRWSRVYAALLTLLGVYIAVFWWITETWR